MFKKQKQRINKNFVFITFRLAPEKMISLFAQQEKDRTYTLEIVLLVSIKNGQSQNLQKL